MQRTRAIDWLVVVAAVMVLVCASPAVAQTQASEAPRPAIATLASGVQVGFAGGYRVAGRADALSEGGRALPAIGGQFRVEFRLPHHLLIGAEITIAAATLTPVAHTVSRI